jgi:LysR family transcriptional regulator, mexEF-oprN operon transcriptional activator
MQSINFDDLKKIDLNLALTFCVIYRECSVTRAAERLYVTQPAISAALARLRALLDDELFVREGRQLRPTPVAVRIYALLEGSLKGMQAAFVDKQNFDPRTATQVFRVGLLDDLEIELLPPLVRALQSEAPNIGISVRATDFRTVAAQIDNDALDLAIGVFDDVPKTAFRKTMFETDFRCLFDPDQLSIGRTLSLSTYLDLAHVIVSFTGDFRGLFEDLGLGRGKGRKIILSVPRFAAIPHILKENPMIATIPSYLAYRFAKMFGLATAPVPHEGTKFHIEMIWPARLNGDPAHSWMRKMVTNELTIRDLLGDKARNAE